MKLVKQGHRAGVRVGLIRRLYFRPYWVVWDRGDLAYLPIPKNANSFLKSVFLQNMEQARDYSVDSETPLTYLKRIQKENRLPDYLRKDPILKKLAGRKIVVLREPFQRLVSAFYDKVVKKYPNDTSYSYEVSLAIGKPIEYLTFADVVEYLLSADDDRRNPHFMSQYLHLRGYALRDFDHVGFVENMERTMEYLEGVGFSAFDDSSYKSVSGIMKKTEYATSSGDYNADPERIPLRELASMDRLPAYTEYYSGAVYKKFCKSYERDLYLYAHARRQNE